jgi:hypothetical protein
MISQYLIPGISTLISTAAFAVSIIVSRRQLSSAKNSQSITVMLSMLGEYREEAMVQARRSVFRHLGSETAAPPTTGFSDIPKEARTAAVTISHFFDNVGLLVAHGLVPADPLISFFGAGAIQLWQTLEPYIECERRTRGSDYYQAYFESFAELAAKRDPEAMIRKVIRANSGSTPPGIRHRVGR